MKNLKPLNFWTTGVPAFFLAALGQWFLIQQDKPGTALTGLLFYGAALVFLRRFSFSRFGSELHDGLDPGREKIFLMMVFLLALFLRVYRLEVFPAGLFTDQSTECLDVLRILREGWRPSFPDLFRQPVCVPSVYAYLCLWFKLFPAGQLSFFLSSVVMSLAAFPFLYCFYRRLSGPTAGLLAIFFMAVMRWHLTYSRDGHPAVEMPFYMGLTLAFWLYAVDRRKTWSFALTGLFLAAALYSYQVGKAFVGLMLIFAVYEWCQNHGSRRKLFGQGALLFVIFSLLCLPLWKEMITQKSLGWREQELMAFPGVYIREGWSGVWNHFLATAFSFNRAGDVWFYHNIPGHRLLDDGMGILLILSLFHGLSRIRERSSFYPVVGFAFMCLPSFLSMNPSHASRLFGTIPFITLLCGNFLAFLARQAGAFRAPGRRLGTFALGALLAFCALQNFRDYFLIQSVQEDCWRNGNGAEASWIGKNLAQDGGQYTYLICPRFYGHYTVQFLGYPHRNDMVLLRLCESLDLRSLPRDKGVCLALEEGQSGILNLFQDLYPGGTTQRLKSPSGAIVATLYRMTAEQIRKGLTGPKFPLAGFGLTGTYFSSLDWNTRPVLTQTDPLINFTFRNDFPIHQFPPLSVWWTGLLEIPKTGTYRFLFLTTDQAKLKIGKETVLASSKKESGDWFLKKGRQKINVFFQKSQGVDTALSLLWMKPGDQKFEVIPYSAFRPNLSLNR